MIFYANIDGQMQRYNAVAARSTCEYLNIVAITCICAVAPNIVSIAVADGKLRCQNRVDDECERDYTVVAIKLYIVNGVLVFLPTLLAKITSPLL